MHVLAEKMPMWSVGLSHTGRTWRSQSPSFAEQADIECYVGIVSKQAVYRGHAAKLADVIK